MKRHLSVSTLVQKLRLFSKDKKLFPIHGYITEPKYGTVGVSLRYRSMYGVRQTSADTVPYTVRFPAFAVNIYDLMLPKTWIYS